MMFSFICSFQQPPVTFFLLDPYVLHCTLVLNILNICTSRRPSSGSGSGSGSTDIFLQDKDEVEISPVLN
jgi:hypothetical protein